MNAREPDNRPAHESWRTKTYDIIFGHHTRSGWTFDVFLLVAIVLSVFVVCIETTPEAESYRDLFIAAEIVFTILFSIEYMLRISCVRNAWVYARSFFGVVDLLAILPSIIGLIWYFAYVGAEGVGEAAGSYTVIRSLRLLRVIRILKLGWLMKEANEMRQAFWRARAKIVVFVGTVTIAVVIAGALMYEIENPTGDHDADFKSIPEAIYWAIVTMATVGYGDLTPKTDLGKLVTSFLILLGYSLIIVPTGFVSAEAVTQKLQRWQKSRTCGKCEHFGHDFDARYCKICGDFLDD